jgi:NAD(P)-dependent dehydrogenase (short-subunit alcohol dehydrogenase family)
LQGKDGNFTMRFSENDIERFLAWSGDHNPLSVDSDISAAAGCREPIVPAILTTFGAIASISSRAAHPLTALDVQFQGAVAPNRRCDVAWVRGPDELSVTVRQEGGEMVTLAGELNADSRISSSDDLAWVARLQADRTTRDCGKRAEPASRDLDELRSGIDVVGVYTTDPPPETATASGHLTPVQARILGLCGYLAGMEAPGWPSSIRRVRVRFGSSRDDSSQLWYRAWSVRFDEESRLLDTRIEVTTPDGQLLATGELQSRVRSMPNATDLGALAARLRPSTHSLAGKVALICGGSRGLGADLAAALALAGCRVYVGFHTSRAAAAHLSRRLAKRNLAVEFLQGDARDPEWCATALENIEMRHGRLDILVLNACARPAQFHLTPQSVQQFDEYVRTNLRLTCLPLATFLPLLEESRGMVASISSSMLTDPQPGFAHFVALKRALEGAVQSATREVSQMWSLIVRAPQLRNESIAQPAAGARAISTEVVAAQIVNRLAGEWRPGQVDWLSPLAMDPIPIRASASEAPHTVVPADDDTDESSPAAAEVVVAEAKELELTETAGLDAQSLLVSIDTIIAAELAHPPAITDERQKLLTFDAAAEPVPVLAEIDHWHEPAQGARSDSPAPPSVVAHESETPVRPIVEHPADVAVPHSEGLPEEGLHELLNELRDEVTETVGWGRSEEIPPVQDPPDVETVSFLDEVLMADTVPMLDVIGDEAPAGDAAPSGSDCAEDASSLEIAATPESPVPEAPADSGKPDASPEPTAVPVTAAVLAPVAEPALAAGNHEITGFAPGVDQEILRFEQQAHPDWRDDRLLPRRNWMYVEAARRLDLEPRVWLCREAGEVAGHGGAVPVKVRIGDAEQPAAWIHTTSHPGADDQEAAVAGLWQHAAAEVQFGLSVVASEATGAALQKLGWVELLRLDSAELMIHPEVVLEGKHPGTTTLADWGWRATTAFRTLFQHRARLDVQQVTRFGERHDWLWKRVAHNQPCGVVRDASYLNWRYIDQPAVETLRLEISDGSAVRGVVILTFREADEAHPYRSAILSDLVAPLADIELVAQLFQVAGTAAAERGADALLCEHAGQPLTRALRQNGFLMREPGRHVFVNPGQLPPELRTKVVSGKDWLLMPGDVDL